MNRFQRYVHGDELSFLLVGDVNIGRINKVKLQWLYDLDLDYESAAFCGEFGCNQRLYVNSAEVSALNNYPEKYEQIPPRMNGTN